jgi:hypothetical protein
MPSSWGQSFLGIGGSWLNTWSGESAQPGDPDTWGTSWGGVGGTWGYSWLGSEAEAPGGGEAGQPAGGSVRGVRLDRRGFYFHYELLAARRRKRKRELQEAEEAAERLKDEVDREIALLMQERERKREFQSNIERLGRLVTKFSSELETQAMSERVRIAFSRAVAQESVSAYLALQREVDRALEEEEIALIMILNDE